MCYFFFFFFKQKTAYEMRISDWSSDVCSSDLLVDVGVGQTARSLDTDLLFLAGTLVLRRNVHDAVGVDVEGHFDLRHPATRRRNADEVELPENLVVQIGRASCRESVCQYV